MGGQSGRGVEDTTVDPAVGGLWALMEKVGEGFRRTRWGWSLKSV